MVYKSYSSCLLSLLIKFGAGVVTDVASQSGSWNVYTY